LFDRSLCQKLFDLVFLIYGFDWKKNEEKEGNGRYW
jgi:hypothetical protein